MSVFLSFTVLGIVSGPIYGILATGLVVTYNTTGVFNFAQGAVGMVAAFSYWQLWQDWHWPFLLAIAVVVFVEAPLLAIVVEFVALPAHPRRLVERSLMVTLGLLVILLGVATIFWSSPDVIRSVPAYFTSADGTVASVHLFGRQRRRRSRTSRSMIVAVAVVVAVRLGLFLRRFRARRRHARRRRRPRAGGHGRGQALPHVADGLGPRLHAGRPGRRADRPAGRARPGSRRASSPCWRSTASPPPWWAGCAACP